MPGKHKNVTISFRPSDWQRALIEERAVLSGHHKKDFIAYQELRRDYLALVVTVVDIINGASYLFDKTPDKDNQHWKADLELEQFRRILE